MNTTTINETEVISIRNAFKAYNTVFGKQFSVLQGLDLTVSYGTIYGLLGPSGCGKTTLLRCVLGCMPLDRGSIHVFGHSPGTKKSGVPGVRVGFMPQDNALMDEFTIMQNFHYYASIAKMTNSKLASRTEFLTKLLHLPASNRILGKLSGGQKRRVSFATALLYSPELLILDEPTVGVDPVLRQRIWDYLFSLVSGGQTTVIITTHYIEEARKANMVGLMLGGRLLAEKEPESLIRDLGCSTLEEAFLHLCCSKEDSNGDTNKTSDTKDTSNDKNKTESNGMVPHWKYNVPDPETESNDGNCKETKDVWFYARQLTRELTNTLVLPEPVRIKASFIKTYHRIRLEPIVALFELFLASVLMIIICSTMGRPPRGIALSVVNEDHGNLGQEFTSYIDSAVILQLPTRNYGSAYEDVVNGYSIGIMHIQSNFSDAILKRYQLAVLSTNETLFHSVISLSLDFTNVHASLSVYQQIMTTFDLFANNTLQDLGIHYLLSGIPVLFHEPFYGRSEDDTAFFVPGCFVILVYFITMGMTTIYFINERQDHRMERDFVSGFNAFDITIGHLICMSLVAIFQVVSMIIVFHLLFQIPCEGSLFLVALLGLGQGVCGVVHGMFVSAICDKENSSIMLGLGIFLATSLSAGAFWPLDGMNPGMKLFSLIFLPQTLTVEAIRVIMTRGWALLHYPVYMATFTTIAWIGFFLLTASIIYRLKS